MIDQNDILSGIDNIFKMIKQQKYDEAQEKILAELDLLFEKEVRHRRMKVEELNKSIFQLNMIIRTTTIQFEMIKKSCPYSLLSSIEEYIQELKKKKVKLEIDKRSVARGVK